MERTKVAVMTSKQNKLFLVASFALIAIIISAPSLVYAQDNLFIFGIPNSPFEFVESGPAPAPEQSNIFSSLAISTMYTNQLQHAIAQTTNAASPKSTSGNTFLPYENNSILGIKIQYPANWEKDRYDKKVGFFAPSLGNPKIIPASLFVDVDNLPFQITYVNDYISHYVNHLRTHAGISEPIRVSLTTLAGNPAQNVTAFAKIGPDEYQATDIILLSGIKKYEITYYIAGAARSSSYLPTIQRMIDSFEINIGITNSSKNDTTSGNFLLAYENSSTLGIKI